MFARLSKLRNSLSCCIAALLLIPALSSGQEKHGEILWDTYGVPHITGTSLSGMYYSFGWAQMHNHANLILRLYGQARGRAAEYWGESYLGSDVNVHEFDLPGKAGKLYEKQDHGYRVLLDAFVSGINDYCRQHPESVSWENRKVLPVRAQDVMAHGLRVVYLVFAAEQEIGKAGQRSMAGSNAYAVGASKSASGNALLVTNPHLPWSGLYTFFEAHLQAPGFDAYGVSLAGMPVLNIAFNANLGWTHTINPIDIADRYELHLKGDGYVLDGNIQPFERKIDTLKILGKDSLLRDTIITISLARQGPVLSWNGEKAYAVRIAGMENANLFFQWHRMAMAGDWRQFEAALRMMQLPMLNIIYADGRGNIAYLFDGDVPRRTTGDWKFWSGVVDGSDSRYIWNDYLPYDSLPKLVNPKTGFLQNANDPPWNCTYPAELDPAAYPAYIAPVGMQWRAQRAMNMIRQDGLISFDKLAAYKLNTGMEVADRFLEPLYKAVKQYGDSDALKAVAVLGRWDRTTDSTSRGAVLFARWFDKLVNADFERPWNPNDPTATPEGLKDPQKAAGLLSKAATEVFRTYGRLDVAWGDVYRFRLGSMDYPASGGAERYGIFRTFYFARDPDRKLRAVAGDSYVAVTEFGKKVRASVLLSYGNASQPGSRHIGDQLPLLSKKMFREAWIDRKDILKHVEERETL